MILTSNYSPTSKVLLSNGFIISAHKRSSFSIQEGCEVFQDSIIVEGVTKENHEELKKLVLFHSFLMRSSYTLKNFEEHTVIKHLNEESVDLIDFDNILSSIFFIEKREDTEPVSYTDLHAIFTKESKENIDLVKNHLTDLSSGLRTSNTIIDTSYWQLMIYYSIIEKIIGRQSHCTILECPECKRTDVHHYALTENEWYEKRIKELVPDNPEAQASYLEIIKVVKKYIRNKTIHSSDTPSANEYAPSIKGETIVYDLERIIGDYLNDPIALTALIHLLKDVARFLILDRLFGLKIFPTPSHLRSTTI